jgi:hypothetical protein
MVELTWRLQEDNWTWQRKPLIDGRRNDCDRVPAATQESSDRKTVALLASEFGELEYG